MNKRALVVMAVLAVVLVGAVVAFSLTRAADSDADASSSAGASAEPSAAATESDAQAEAGAPVAPGGGSYIDYSESAIADAEGTTLLFFHASWCPQCRALDADIVASGVPDGVTIIKVDYDSHQDLRQRYGVTLQTTVVEVDSEGTELQKFVPYDDPSLDSVVAEML